MKSAGRVRGSKGIDEGGIGDRTVNVRFRQLRTLGLPMLPPPCAKALNRFAIVAGCGAS